MARILVIDDDHAVQLTLEVILERAGHEVICAADGDLGLRAFASAAPQLIITDIIMPNKQGIEMIMEIRAGNATTPIILMSGGGRVGNDDLLEMALRVGADEALAKPFEREELVAAARRLLSARSMPAIKSRAPLPAHPAGHQRSAPG